MQKLQTLAKEVKLHEEQRKIVTLQSFDSNYLLIKKHL